MTHSTLRAFFFCFGLAALGGCGEFPEVVGAVDDDIGNAPYPQILPNTEALVAETPRLHSGSDEALEAREQRLRNRARAL
jgi:hypothetical protein